MFLEKIINKYWFLILLVLSIPAVWALLVPGFYGASDDLHISWLFEMDRSIQAGQFPPRFVPDLSYGFGYPLFNFVFPLPFYIGELFHKLGLTLVDSVKSVFFLSLVTSAISMFLLLKEFTSKSLSLVGSLIYLYTPYRSTDVYIRGAIGESVAFVFFPLIILSIYKLSLKNKIDFRWIGVGSISLAGLVLSHNIATYMFLPFAGVLGVILLFNNLKNYKFILLNLSGMFLLGLTISGYFWIPALVDSGLVKYDTVFDFKDHYPTLIQLVKPYFGYGASVPGPYDGMSFFLGFINVLLIVWGAINLLIFRKKYSSTQKMILIWVFLALLITVFMMNFRSTFVWEHLPLLPYFQFPWRFLMLTTFVTPLLIISLDKIKFKEIFSVILILGVILMNWNYFRPHDFLGRIDSYYLNRYIPYPEASDDYKQTQEEYLRLPKDTTSRPDKNYPVLFSDRQIEYQVKEINSLHKIINVTSVGEQTINVNKYNFPGWNVLVDDKLVDIHSGQPFGQISFNIPSGNSTIDISFRETQSKLVLNWLALLGLLIAMSLIVKGKTKNAE